MSDLSNLYISESYYGVVNLIDSTEPFASQSEAKIYLTDGLGENLGISFDSSKNITIDNDLRVDGNADFNGNVDISGSFVHTGSIDVIGDVTVVGNITAHTGSFDTINTRILHVTLESSSVIFSSGSNVFGDEITDTQTLVGQVSISGSLKVNGASVITGSLNVTNEISSSTINGIGNVTLYSQSVDSRLTNLQLDSASQDQRLDSLEFYTSSNDTKWNTLQSVTSSLLIFTGSTNQRLNSLEAFTASLTANFVTDLEYSSSIAVVTGSLINEIDTKLDSASFNTWTGSVFLPFSSSVSSDIATVYTNISNLSGSIATTNLNQQNQINSLISETGSYAKLVGTNNFSGSQIITGSVRGNVENITISSATASIDCSKGNFFTLSLPTGSSTYFTATNIVPGQTLSVKVNTQNNTTASIDSNTIKMLGNAGYTPSQVSTTDILTFVSFDSTSLFGVVGNFFG
jgi:cytoskeletal protein CcmA (bactofilin family)